MGWVSILRSLTTFAAAATVLAPPMALAAQQAEKIQLSAAQVFELAARAEQDGAFVDAERAYRALAADPDADIRAEARFRLALMLADRMGDVRKAATELRAILDEMPNAGRVRVELARMNAMMGNLGAAERELRAAEAGGLLPPEVAQAVRFFANALSVSRPFGGSLELAFAPDSNVNRATRADTLGTVIGDFDLDEEAQAQSGVGLALRGQGYARLPVGSGTLLMARLSASGNIYRQSAFNDIALGLLAGPEFDIGKDRLALSAGPIWRWYGMDPYSLSLTTSAKWQHALNPRSSLRIDAGASRINNRRNDLQDGAAYALSVGVDRAFSARLGGGLQANIGRTTARDPGYADVTFGGAGYLFREFGRTTAVLSVSYARLEADARLALYAQRRTDNLLTAAGTLTLRRFRIGTFAPYIRLRAERNASTVELYDFKRLAGETGLTAAF